MTIKPKPKVCKSCKSKFMPFNSLTVACSIPCAIKLSNVQKQKDNALEASKSRKETRERKEKLKTWMDYVKELEVIFNEFIRVRDKDQPCISCDAIAGQYKLTAGHFYPTTYQYLRFNEDNVNSQCWFNCNRNRRGNLSEYRPRLIKKIGKARVDKLERTRHNNLDLSIPQIKELKAKYRAKIKALK